MVALLFLPEIIIFLITIAVTVYVYYVWSYKYWKNRNVPTLPTKFLTGNLENPITSDISQPMYFKRFYNQFKRLGVKHGGIYMFASPVYVPIDLSYIKNILTVDYQNFNSRGMYQHDQQAISKNLFFMEGDAWKNMRAKLTPTFTTGKMKMMYDILLKTSENMLEDVGKDNVVNIKQTAVRFTTDIIGSCAFGIECNSFKDSDTEFIKQSKSVVQPTRLEAYKDMICFAVPNVAKKLNLKPFRQSCNAFFTEIVTDVLNYRNGNNVTRNDFMQSLIDMKNGKNISGEVLEKLGGDFTVDMMIAQAFVFFIAGFETSSSTMTFCLYELARNEAIQKRAREEVERVLKKHEGNCSYDALMEMKYLNQIVDETLRIYPIVANLTRRCTATYKMPNTDLVIDEGTTVVIPILGIHSDPEYFPNPEKFDPDRFSDQNKQNIKPYSYMPFGEGPRICIGLRFGIMQAKLGLARLLNKYAFSVNKRTIQPLEFETSVLLCAKGDIWLDVKNIES